MAPFLGEIDWDPISFPICSVLKSISHSLFSLHAHVGASSASSLCILLNGNLRFLFISLFLILFSAHWCVLQMSCAEKDQYMGREVEVSAVEVPSGLEKNGSLETNFVHDPEQGTSTRRWMYAGRSKTHWLLVISSILALIVGQCPALLLSRYYFDKGGNSRWLSTLLQSVGWPILVIPLVLYRQKQASKLTTITPKLLLVYVALGLLVAGDNLLYSWGISFMPASTYSLLCSSQLAFNAAFAWMLNKQKINPYILNSLVLLTFGAVLLEIHSDSDLPEGVSKGQYIAGFFCTVGASALYGLILPLMQLVFQKILKEESFTVVLEMQIFTAIVATVVCIMGLFIGGDFRDIREEALSFRTGKIAYYMTLIWSAIGWQVCAVGVVGLIFLVSSLFSNVISTLALPVVPILAVVFFHDKVSALKVMSMLLALWGFSSYVFGGYVESKAASGSRNEQQSSLAET